MPHPRRNAHWVRARMRTRSDRDETIFPYQGAASLSSEDALKQTLKKLKFKGKVRHAQITNDFSARAALSAIGRQGCRRRGKDNLRTDDPELGGWKSYRDPRFWQFLCQSPAAAHRAKSEIRRTSKRAGEIRAALQSWQGTARTGAQEEEVGKTYVDLGIGTPHPPLSEVFAFFACNARNMIMIMPVIDDYAAR